VAFNGTAGYGTVRLVVWEDGGRKPTSYPIKPTGILMLNGGENETGYRYDITVADYLICLIKK
jgi:hypothetical protein